MPGGLYGIYRQSFFSSFGMFFSPPDSGVPDYFQSFACFFRKNSRKFFKKLPQVFGKTSASFFEKSRVFFENP
jgi:hypothetical protein